MRQAADVLARQGAYQVQTISERCVDYRARHDFSQLLWLLIISDDFFFAYQTSFEMADKAGDTSIFDIDG